MGLPRSSLVKSKSSEAARVAGPASPSTGAPAGVPAASPQPLPPALSALPVSVWAPATAPIADAFAATASFPDAFTGPAIEDAPARESFRTKADSIEVQMESQRAPDAMNASLAAREPMRAPYTSAPSSTELLERAAALGPARMTWESIVLPTDPILDEKRQPRVAERRARLTRIVKATLGACVGLCVLAVGVSAVSGDPSPTPAASTSSTMGKTVASKAVVPVEPLAIAKHAKAVRRTAPAVTTAAIARGPKRR